MTHARETQRLRRVGFVLLFAQTGRDGFEFYQREVGARVSGAEASSF
jgi:hypothetical protein